MTDFFISYTAADRAWAEWIAWVLEDAKHTTKIQAWSFQPGGHFAVEIRKASADAARIIVVLSPDYLESLDGMTEGSTAFLKDPSAAGGIMFPVLVRKAGTGGLLAQKGLIDLVYLEEDGARGKLLGGVDPGVDPVRVKPVERAAFPGLLRRSFPGPVRERRLAAMPLDTIPGSEPLPPGSRMPFAVNPLFVGREDELRTLARQLKAGNASAVVQVESAATGLGGIGKTELAAEFVHRYGRYFEGGVFWLSFADPAAVPAEVVACGRRMDLLPGYNGLLFAEQIRLVEDAWTRSIPRLLVFDNCEEEELFYQWRPRCGGARVLVTSRLSHWDRALGLQEIALRREGLHEHVSRNFALSFERLNPDDATDALALALLARAACLSPGKPIPSAFLVQTLGLDEEDQEAQWRAEDALSRLTALGLLKPEEPGTLSMHELVADLARTSGEEEVARNAIEDALCVEIARLKEADDAAPALALQPQLRAIAEKARRREDERAARLCNELGDHLRRFGDAAEALLWHERALEIREKILSPDHLDIAQSLSNLGALLEARGAVAEAGMYYERALAIQEKAHGPKSRATADSLSHLGGLLQSQGNLAEAFEHYERALAIQENVHGPESLSTARSLLHLGSFLRNQARLYSERALAIFEARLGPEDPMTKLARRFLGSFGPPSP